MNQPPNKNDSEERNESALPVVLCHAACTGGSFIYRLLLATFNLFGVCEIGHARKPRVTDFYPLDPQAQIYLRGEMSPQDFGDILFERLESATDFAAARQQRLLIREYTHGYFFEPDQGNPLPTGPSWVVDNYKSRLGVALPLIVSVRDPIDSWLGLRKNFPKQQPSDFSTYCRIYNQFVDRLEAARSAGDPIMILRYEELVRDQNTVFTQLAEFIGETYQGVDFKKVAGIPSSGSSGRQSAKPDTRPRRAFTTGFVREAAGCADYQKLCQRMEYDLIHENLTSKQRIQAFGYQIVRLAGAPFRFFERPAIRMVELLKSFRGIQ